MDNGCSILTASLIGLPIFECTPVNCTEFITSVIGGSVFNVGMVCDVAPIPIRFNTSEGSFFTIDGMTIIVREDGL